MKKFVTYCAWSDGFLEMLGHQLEDSGIEPGDSAITGYDLHAAILELEIGEALTFEMPFNGKQTLLRVHDVEDPDKRTIVVTADVNLRELGITEEELKECAFDITFCPPGNDVERLEHPLYEARVGGTKEILKPKKTELSKKDTSESIDYPINVQSTPTHTTLRTVELDVFKGVVTKLVDRSCWFEVTPLPDGVWEARIKREGGTNYFKDLLEELRREDPDKWRE